MTSVRRLWILLLSVALLGAGLLLWPFGETTSSDGGTGLNQAGRAPMEGPTFKDRQEAVVPYDAAAETATAAAAAEMAAKEQEKDAEVPDHLLALGDNTLTDEQVRARLRRAVLDAALSAEERAEALEHLHNLSAGRSSEQLLPVAQDSAMTPDLLAEMLDESLNRDFFYQADLALSVLEKRREPELIEAARRQLAFLVGADHGLDIAQWRAALALISGDWERESPPIK